ncbi:aspartate/glutamate racemase family protein [Chloroflexota bacterium]
MKIWYQSGLNFERFKSYEKYLTEHVRAAAEPGTTIEVFGTTRGGTGVEYRFTEYLFTREILENAFKAEEQGFDAFTIGTTNDAGLFQAREVLKIPVIGITQTSLLVACMMGRNFSLITPNEKMISQFEELILKYGFKEKLTSIECTDFQIPELGKMFDNPALKNTQLQGFTKVARNAIKEGSEVIIPIGGIASLVLAKSGVNQIDGVPVLDTISIVIKMTEMMVRLGNITGTFVSRRLSFASPPNDILKELRNDYKI